ncbi:ATP-binding protein [Streptomyces sp. NBC_01808]|uniref:ATP-binding protein n=1 Tax=Streptomyces sp. NBC_01808 TaxID=2975947 RepID=UPI002DDBCE2E|nr:ATP-binding protein [Streptomyces sp. NBC_01808]WSA40790.1 ATP-binding protein [Streptomyces sp. NBC_01808]
MAGLEDIQQLHRDEPAHPEALAVRRSRRKLLRPLPSPAYRRFPTAAPADGAAGTEAPAPMDHWGNPAVGEVRLPSRPESAGTARRLAEAVVVRHWGMSPGFAEHAVLLVSELVGNAVRHTGARTFGLRMSRGRGRIRIEVRDPSRALPCLMPVRDMDTSGRGLFLIDQVADRWGVDLLPRGKCTWVELCEPERS